jgi:hypothetical protein
MALPGEITNGASFATCTCGSKLPLQVCKSYAGYYLGYICYECCSLYGRESHYFSTKEEALEYHKNFMIDNDKSMMRDDKYHGGK